MSTHARRPAQSQESTSTSTSTSTAAAPTASYEQPFWLQKLLMNGLYDDHVQVGAEQAAPEAFAFPGVIDGARLLMSPDNLNRGVGAGAPPPLPVVPDHRLVDAGIKDIETEIRELQREIANLPPNAEGKDFSNQRATAESRVQALQEAKATAAAAREPGVDPSDAFAALKKVGAIMEVAKPVQRSTSFNAEKGEVVIRDFTLAEDGTVLKTTVRTYSIASGLSISVSEQPVQLDPDTVARSGSAKLTKDALTATGGVSFGDTKAAGPGKDAVGTSTNINGKLVLPTSDGGNWEIGAGLGHTDVREDQSKTTMAGNLSAVGGKDGTGGKASMSGSGRHVVEDGTKTDMDASIGATLTDKKVGVDATQSVSQTHASGVKVGLKVSKSGSYSANIVKDEASGLYKLTVTIDLSLGGKLNGAFDQADSPNKSKFQQSKGAGGASVGASLAGTITQVRVLTAEEVLKYQVALDDADKGKQGAKEPELSALAHARAGLGEGLDLVQRMVGSPDTVGALGAGDSLTVTLTGGVEASGSAGSQGVSVGASGSASVTRTLSIERLKDDGERRPVRITINYGASSTTKGSLNAGNGAASLGANASRTAGEGEGVRFVLDTADPAYRKRHLRLMASPTLGDAKKLAEDPTYGESAWLKQRSEASSDGVNLSVLGGAGQASITRSDSQKENLVVDKDAKRLVGTSVEGKNGLDIKASGVGDLLGATYGESDSVQSKIGDEGLETKLSRETSSGLSVGSWFDTTTKTLTDVSLSVADMKALSGRAANAGKWDNFTDDFRVFPKWLALGSALRAPRLAKAEREELTAQGIPKPDLDDLARARALASYIQNTGGIGRNLLDRALTRWDASGPDLGRQESWPSSLAQTKKVWDQLPGLLSATVAAQSGGLIKVAEAHGAFSQAANQCREAISASSELDARSKASMLMHLNGLISKARAAYDLATGSEASEDGLPANAALREREVMDQERMLVQFRRDEVRLFTAAFDKLDSWFASASDRHNAFQPVVELHDVWEPALARLQALYGAKGRANPADAAASRGPNAALLQQGLSASVGDSAEAKRAVKAFEAWRKTI